MSPARCATLTNIGRWTCLAGALLFAALSLASQWWWLKCWGTVDGRRLCAGVDRGSAYVFFSSHWPDRVPHPDWYIAAEPRLSYSYTWWGWFWPWNTLTTPGGWFRQFAFPSWVPIPILGAAGALLWRAHRRAGRDLIALCPHCAYDRRGLPAAAPCPECGAVPSAA